MNSTPPNSQTETWATLTAATAAAIAVLKKLLGRRQSPKPEYITRAEFHHQLDAMRDRIGAGYLALADKLDANHRELLSALTAQGDAFEHRIDQLETNLARVDERTLH